MVDLPTTRNQILGSLTAGEIKKKYLLTKSWGIFQANFAPEISTEIDEVE